MKRVFVPVISAVALIGAMSMASADEVKGRVLSIDQENKTLTLDSGEQFTVGEGVSLDELQPGSEVTVSFQEQSDGRKVAQEIEKGADMGGAAGAGASGAGAGTGGAGQSGMGEQPAR